MHNTLTIYPGKDSDSLTHDSVPDTLTGHSVPVFAGLDWERDGWRVSVDGAPATKVSRDALLGMKFDGVDHVIVEQAHMRERNIYSVAQVYTADELDSLACRAKVKLFPGMPGQLARAAREVGNITDKVNEYGHPLPDKTKDAETMALFAKKSPNRVSSWKPLRAVNLDPSRRLWPARQALRDDLKEALNPLRSAWNVKPTAERYALPEVVRFCELLDRIFDDLTDGIKEQFGIRRSRNGIRVERMSAAITCYLAVYTREGERRSRPDGGFIGIRFILDAIGLSSSYRPNMARSQLTHYGMRRYKGGRGGGCRSEYMRNLRRFLAIMRDAATISCETACSTRSRDTDSAANSGSDSLTHDSVPDTLTHHSVPAADLEQGAL
jgi:hypothetical protein